MPLGAIIRNATKFKLYEPTQLAKQIVIFESAFVGLKTPTPDTLKVNEFGELAPGVPQVPFAPVRSTGEDVTLALNIC